MHLRNLPKLRKLICITCFTGFLFGVLFAIKLLINPSFEVVLRSVKPLSTSKVNTKLKCMELITEKNNNGRKNLRGYLSTPRQQFTFDLLPETVIKRLETSVCGVSANTTHGSVVVHLIKSSLLNHERRQTIRSTWASVKVVSNCRQEVVFIIGTSKLSLKQNTIKAESLLYGDILQYNLDDGRENLPLKVLAGMQWAAQYLRSDWLYTSCDDDMIINPFNLFTFISHITEYSQTSPQPPCYHQLPIICLYIIKYVDRPDRQPRSKWYTSEDMYPHIKWPPYCRGGSYLMPVRIASKLYEVSRYIEYINMDDVWITGLMREKLEGGDSNIYASPYSERGDLVMFYEAKFKLNFIGITRQLVRHLWGNIDGSNYNVIDDMKSEWKSLTTSLHANLNGSCYT